VLPGPADQLPRRRFGRLQDVGDLPVRVVEGLAQQVRRALAGREPFQQQPGGELQGLGALGAEVRVRARVDRFRLPRPDGRLATHPRRPERVDRQPGRRRREERGRVEDRGAVAGLPPEPGVLHDVLGLAGAAQQAARDAEQARPHAGEDRRGRLEVVRRLRTGVRVGIRHHAPAGRTAAAADSIVSPGRPAINAAGARRHGTPQSSGRDP
jgi:hypothetical protein